MCMQNPTFYKEFNILSYFTIFSYIQKAIYLVSLNKTPSTISNSVCPERPSSQQSTIMNSCFLFSLSKTINLILTPRHGTLISLQLQGYLHKIQFFNQIQQGNQSKYITSFMVAFYKYIGIMTESHQSKLFFHVWFRSTRCRRIYCF